MRLPVWHFYGYYIINPAFIQRFFSEQNPFAKKSMDEKTAWFAKKLVKY